jgi:hypothetical protein
MRHPDFADVDLGQFGFGALGGAGADEHHQAHSRLDSSGQGVWYTVHCDNCGQSNGILVSWNEFVYGANRLVPPGWQHEPAVGGMHPNVGCQQCRAVLLVTFTPDECQRQIKAGIMANQIQEGQVAAMSQQLQQSRGQFR